MIRPRLLRLSYMLWIVGPLAVYGAYHTWGLPHAIWAYSYVGGSDFSDRRYITCTFTGPYGEFTVPASNGKCGWVLFRKKPGSRP